MKPDIRKQTGLIIRRNGEYLVGVAMLSDGLRWSVSPYDAWRTRDTDKARKVARAVGGTVMLFNPVARQMRVF